MIESLIKMKPSSLLYLYSTLLFTLIVSPDSFSQISEKTVIHGIVVDAKTGDRLAGTSVFLEKTTVGTITDVDGKYKIETSVKSDNIKFSFLGYNTEVRSISYGTDQTINVS